MEANTIEKKIPNYIPSIVLLVTVVVLVAVFGILSINDDEETIQGQAEVKEYRVSTKVPSRIAAILVEEGQFVHAGDTLALLEAPEVDAKLSQARAAEDAAAAQRRKAEKGTRAEQVLAAYEMWQKAKAGVDIMEKSYRRIKNLFDQGVMTAQKLDEITAQRDAAVATERAAHAQYQMAVNGAQQEDKDAAEALVARARGAVSEVNAYVGETVLLASADGEVTEIFPMVGELVGSGAPIMNIAIMADKWVTFNIREDHLADIKMNGSLKVTIPALGNKEATLKVYYIKDLGSFAAWRATKTTGQFDMKTFQVKARPTAEIEGLRPGMSVLLTSKK